MAWPTDDQLPLLNPTDVAKHATPNDLWIILHHRVYDLTQFLPDHPGGKAVILKYAGKDGTKAFDAIHPPDIVKRFLTPNVIKGRIDPTMVSSKGGEESDEEKRIRLAREALPPLSAMLNLFDFEASARSALSPEAWAYYSSGADDEITLRENRSAYLRIWLKPRVMVNVKHIDASCTMLGAKATFPVYVTATALGKLGHPEGEVVLTRACGTRGVPQMLPTLASCSLDEMCDARIPGQTQWFQLYVNQDRKVTQRLIEHAEARGCTGLFITVDAPQLGKREKDMRMKFVEDAPDVQTEAGLERRDQGAARAISSFIDPGLCWDDVKWFQLVTKMPIVLKGVQCAEDAVLAYRHGCAGIVLSNHGGRQLDTARSGIEILPEVMKALREANIPKKRFQVFVDGGIRRGTDVFKAIALGADGVGIGRPFLYAMGTYGQPGVERAMDILRDELEVTMRLMGTPTLRDIQPGMVLTQSLPMHTVQVPKDVLGDQVYEPIPLPKSKL